MGLLSGLLKRRKKVEMNAVYNSDIEGLLRSLEVLDEVTEGKRDCDKCGEQLTLDSIGSIYGEDGDVKLTCKKLKCLK